MIGPRLLWTLNALLLVAACAEDADHPFYVGYVEAEWVYVAAPQSGWLAERPVRQGDEVRPGQILFELDKDRQLAAIAEIDARVTQAGAQARDVSTGARPAEVLALKAQLAEAEARLMQASLERDRVLPLAERGIEPDSRADQVVANAEVAEAAVHAARENINVAELAGRAGARDAAEALVSATEAQLEGARLDLRERTVVAQRGGRIERVFHQPGEFVTLGNPVLAMLPEDGLKIKFFVTQEDLPQLSIGKAIRAKADGLPSFIDARITYIATDAEFTPPVIYSRDARSKLTFLVEATLPSGSGLRPGLPVDVDWT